MGIGPEPAQMLRDLRLPKGFTVCELGSQRFHQGKRSINGKPNPEWWSKPARELYESMGCSRYESIDADGEAIVTADLNYPLDGQVEDWGAKWLAAFDLVTDFGTIEHLGNPGQGWKTMHELCKVGGLIVGDKPIERYKGHGLFLHDEFFFAALAGLNDYKILHLSKAHAGRGTCQRFVFQRMSGAGFVYARQGKWKWRVEAAE
jgi:hypothetical protein